MMTDLAEYIARVVDEAPPLSPAQRSRLAFLLNPRPAAWSGPMVESESARVEREARQEREAKAKALRDHIANLTACAICGVPEVGHRIQERDSLLGFHEWEPKAVVWKN